jgi:hypothetical protein
VKISHGFVWIFDVLLLKATRGRTVRVTVRVRFRVMVRVRVRVGVGVGIRVYLIFKA